MWQSCIKLLILDLSLQLKLELYLLCIFKNEMQDIRCEAQCSQPHAHHGEVLPQLIQRHSFVRSSIGARHKHVGSTARGWHGFQVRVKQSQQCNILFLYPASNIMTTLCCCRYQAGATAFFVLASSKLAQQHIGIQVDTVMELRQICAVNPWPSAGRTEHYKLYLKVSFFQ